jgi:hypothetical protein
MSDEYNDEPEVEGHVRQGVNIEPDVENEADDEVEAHVRMANVRMDSPRQA